MTNEKIILHASMELMEQGIIKGSGEFFQTTIPDEEGNMVEKTIEMPEPIHTFQKWKELGYSVMKGQKAKASFMIWKYSSKTKEDENGEEIEDSRMFMKKAFFFTFDQVEPIKVKNA